MATLSVVVITLNEEHNIAACLDTVSWADDVVIVDSGSSDATVALAQQHGARVLTHPFTNFAEQKNVALAQATGDWILSLDADERVTPELQTEIRQAIANPRDISALEMPRLDRIFGRWIRHGLWWPQYKLRVVRRGHGQWRGEVHELLETDGPTLRLRSPLLHHHCQTVSEFVQKVDRYTTMEARSWHAAGVRPSLWKMLFYPIGLFLYDYVWLRGMLDGMHGFVLACLMAYYTFLKRAKLWELATETKDDR